MNNKQRWWEFYLVRYFVGTVVGSLIMYYLAVQPSSSFKGILFPDMKGSLLDLGAAGAVVLGLAGFSYCYIASAPILVFHAVRFSFTENKKFQFSPLTMFFFAFWLAMAAFVCHYFDQYNIWGRLALVLAGTIIILQFRAILQIAACKNEYIGFYRDLSRKRADDEEIVQEYIESYRHLREHGNAFFIVFFEIVLGVSLWFIPNMQFTVIMLMLWVLPAALIWFYANELEADLIGRE